ncbi:MAG: MaoC family dehydratase N-terminal domain-containing protein, partial [Hyphomicrobiales bacterium]|nr:MaoC family dehydratase N-terminal domain-containing protein [Hyphomicrobiales bacterium]
MPKIFFEDFHVGARGECGPRTVTRDEIVAFAREFDPQPFHLDEEAAKSTFVGELIASGWHTCALMMRIMFDGMIHNSSSMGAPGMEEVKWQKPVRPGDTVTARWNVLETRSSRSRPDMGLVRLRIDLVNQRGETACQQLFWMMAGRRDVAFAKELGNVDQGKSAAMSSPEPAASAAPRNFAKLEAKAQLAAPKLAPALAYFDDLVVGETTAIGSYAFTAENIIRFARAFDPQPFHVDAQAAAKSHFGGLCASGWHTGAACMRKLIDRRTALRDAMLAQGLPPPAMGSSPG